YSNGPLYRVSAEGGDPHPVTALDSTRGETAQRFPILLPDGQHFLYASLPAKDGKLDIRLASFGATQAKTVLRAEAGVAYANGNLLAPRAGKLVPPRWSGGGAAGEPIPIGDAPIGSSLTGAPFISASQAGSILYLPVRFPNTHLVWMDLEGHDL